MIKLRKRERKRNNNNKRRRKKEKRNIIKTGQTLTEDCPNLVSGIAGGAADH